jgi:hypothetical protein
MIEKTIENIHFLKIHASIIVIFCQAFWQEYQDVFLFDSVLFLIKKRKPFIDDPCIFFKFLF